MIKTILAGGLAAFLAAGTAAAAPGERADVNREQTVSIAEMQQRIGERFARIDANRDGNVTKAEYDAVREKRSARRAARAERRQGERGDLFATLDGDSNGALTLGEYQARATQRVQRFDSNKDGVVSREEFAAGHKARKERRRHRD